MKVKEKEMFHFNNNEDRKDIWQAGNIFEMPKDFISDFYKHILYFKSVVDTEWGTSEMFYTIIDDYLDGNLDNDEAIEILDQARRFLRNFETQKRELVVEAVRKELYPELPSRKNSIWLCDENSIEYWKSKFDQVEFLELFRVEVTGTLFKSSDYLLPTGMHNIIESYEKAKEYWNPNFKLIPNDRTEYLFNGKVKILEQINIR